MPLRWMIGAAAAVVISASATAEAASQAVTLRARDGVSISGLAYTADHPRAIVLLFHQAESSKAEYATIAPRLAAAGFTALAIDQRSGGSLYGPNETARRLAKPAGYEQAKPDLRKLRIGEDRRSVRDRCAVENIEQCGYPAREL